MADYYTLEQLAQKLGVTEGLLVELEISGLFQLKIRCGKRFFSSCQARDLLVALRLTRKQKASLQEAFEQIEDLRPCQNQTWLGRLEVESFAIPHLLWFKKGLQVHRIVENGTASGAGT